MGNLRVRRGCAHLRKDFVESCCQRLTATTEMPPTSTPPTSSTSTSTSSNQNAKPNSKPPRDKQTVGYMARSFVAGGVAGCIAKTALAPLDRVKILFQTNHPHYTKYTGSLRGASKAVLRIIETQGGLGLFQGHAATLLRVYPYAAVKFMSYEQIKHVMMPRKRDETSFRRFTAGALAGCVSVIFTYPLEVIRVRLAVDVRTDPSAPRARFRDTTRAIYREPNILAQHVSVWLRPWTGITNFYRGIMPTLYGIIPYAGVSFLTYETLKGWVMAIPELEEWAIKNVDEVRENRRQRQLVRDTLEQSAAAIDFVHHPPGSMHLVAGSYAHASTDSSTAHALGIEMMPLPVKPILNAWPNLLIGGVSGITAQTASYPFEIVRRQMQVGGQATTTSGAGAITSLQYPTTWQVARHIWSTRGFSGFWVGITIGYIKVIPMFAISFYSYEWLKIVFEID